MGGFTTNATDSSATDKVETNTLAQATPEVNANEDQACTDFVLVPPEKEVKEDCQEVVKHRANQKQVKKKPNYL